MSVGMCPDDCGRCRDRVWCGRDAFVWWEWGGGGRDGLEVFDRLEGAHRQCELAWRVFALPQHKVAIFAVLHQQRRRVVPRQPPMVPPAPPAITCESAIALYIIWLGAFIIRDFGEVVFNLSE